MAITYQSAGALNYQTTSSFAVAHPASIVAGDYLVLFVGQKPDTASVTTPSGWTLLNTTSGGTGTTGVDTGPTRITAYGKVAVGGETGNLTVAHTGMNVGWAQMYRFTKTTGDWGTFAAGGSDSTAGAAWSVSVTAANGSVAGGDFLIVGSANPTDVDTQPQFSAQAVSATGLTMGTMTAISEPESLANNDIGGFVFNQAVTSGSNTTNLTVSATRGGTTTNIHGPSIVVRLREVSSGPITVTPTAIASSEAFGTTNVSTFLTVTPTALGTGEAFGTTVASTFLTATPTAIGSGEAFGTVAAAVPTAVSAVAIGSAEAFGTVEALSTKTTTGTATATASTSASTDSTRISVVTQPATADTSATVATIRTTSGTATAHGANTAVSGGVRSMTGAAPATASVSSTFTTQRPHAGTATAIASASESHTPVHVTDGTATAIASVSYAAGGETVGTATAIATVSSENFSTRSGTAAATAVASVSSSFTVTERTTVDAAELTATASAVTAGVRSTEGTATMAASIEFDTSTIRIVQVEVIAIASASSEVGDPTTVGEAVAIISATAYTYRLEKTLMICYPETTNWGATDPVLIDNEQRQLAEAFAWTTLHVLGGRMIAICPSAVRPIRPRCRDSYTFDRFGIYDLSANVYPAFEHLAGCMCDRTSVITLPGLIGRIQRVTIDGVDLPAYAYRVEDGQRLVRQDGSAWPAWQDMTLPVGEEGTFEIVYWDGIAPNAMLNYAAGVLANEYLKLLTGEKGCRLPKSVSQVSRQGVTYTIDSSIFANGVTDIKEVDNVIALYNPNKLKAPPVVYSTDLHSTRLRSLGV